MSEFARFQKEQLTWNGQQFMPIDNIAGGNCNYLAMMDSKLLPCRDAAALRDCVASFGLGPGRLLAERLFSQFETRCDQQTFIRYFEKIKLDGAWTGVLEQCLVAALYGVDVVSLSNTTNGLMQFRSSFWMTQQCSNVEGISEMIPDRDAAVIYLYHHQYQRPLRQLPSGSFQLNHFCALLPISSISSRPTSVQNVSNIYLSMKLS
jgi:hypothetical protein